MRNRLFLTLFLITLTLGLVVAAEIAKPVQAVTNSSHVITTAPTGDHYVYESSYQNPGFYANGLYWIFYEDNATNCEHQGGCFYYVTSPDSGNWSSPHPVVTPTGGGIHVTDSDWSVANVGSQVFYARYNESSFDTDCYRALLYGSGTISGGSITWQAERVVRNPISTSTFPNEVISVDTNNQVWIGYQEDSKVSCGGTGHQTARIINANLPLPPAPLSTGFTFSPSTPIPLSKVTFTATAQGGTPSYTYRWSFDDGSVATGQSVSHNFTSSGAHPVTLTTTDSSGTQQSATSSRSILVGLSLTQTNGLSLIVPSSMSVGTGQAIVFTVNASDTDLTEKVSNSTGALPAGANFDPKTGLFRWIPTSDEANQIWVITFNSTDTGNPPLFVTNQVLIDVMGDTSLPATQLSQSISDNWHVDIATLSGGQVYAAYWANKFPLFGRLYDGSKWLGEDQVSLTTEATDVNSFIFGSGSSVYAVWFDTNKGTLNAGIRPPGLTSSWQQNLIGPGEAKSVCGLLGNVAPQPPCTKLHRYSLPITAAFDLTHAVTYVFWYNQTNNVIDEWSGSGGTWRFTPGAFSTQASGPEFPIGSFHYSVNVNNKDSFGIVWIDGVNVPYRVNFALETVGSVSTFSTDTSWNPKVQCTPIVVTIEQILGNQTRPSGGATESGSIFNPGITAPSPGDAKRWLTPSSFTNTLSGWQPGGPPCRITNADGQNVAAFVEVRGVQRTVLNQEDPALPLSAPRFDPVNGGGLYPNPVPFNDTTFSIYTPGYGVCTAQNTTGCMHRIHVEFDHDWKEAGYCGSNTVCDPFQLAQQTAADKSLIDFQGFVYWDAEHVGEASHSFSGWEIHPLTAWRISCLNGQFCNPTYTLSANPGVVQMTPGQRINSTITVNTFNLFSGPLTLSAIVSPSNPSDPTVTFTPNPVNVPPCNQCAAANSTLTVTALSSSTGTYIVTIAGPNCGPQCQATVTVQVQGFFLLANPTSLTVPAGGSVNSTITVTSLGSFSGPVNLSASSIGCACGLVPKFSPNPVILSAGQKANATLTITTAGSQTGNAQITVTGTSGSVTASTTISVADVDFGLSSNPTSATVLANKLANSTITIAALNGFTGSVTISKTVPAGLTCSLSQTNISLSSTQQSGTSTLQCSGPAGNYLVVVTANSTGIIHTATFGVTVQDYSIFATPAASMVDVGTPGTSTIRVTAVNGFTGTITLNQNGGAPCGLSAPNVVLTSTTTAATVVLTCSYQSTVTSTVQVASTSGPLSHSVTVTFQIVDFTISAGPTSQTIDAGAKGTSTVTLTGLNGYNRTVTLNLSPVAGITCVVSPIKITLQPTPVTSILSCSSTTAADYTLTVTGTNGTLSHPTSGILYHVIDFALTTNIPTLTLGVGQNSQAAVVQVGSLNGFTGTVSISVLITPSGPSATPTFSSLKVPLGGNQTSLNINAGQVAGLYTLNITAARGSLSHWKTMTLKVTPNTPILSTSLSSTNPTVGTSVTDSATLSGATSTASGTVIYYLFSNGGCRASATSQFSVPVTNGAIPSTRPIVFNATGPYSFNATYSGDNNNGPTASPCEPLTVQKDNPTITTSLSATSIQVGQSVTDSATLSTFFQAGGTVNYNLFVGSSSCAGTSSTASTVTVTNGAIPNSRSVTFNSTNPGGYSFQAVYSGDANNNGVTSGCEPLTVNPVGVTITTSLSATAITVGGTASDTSTLQGKTSTAGGTVTYNDFANGNCAAPGTVVFIVTVNNGVVPNSRTVTFNSSGTFSFNAVYSGDANNNGATSGCESLTVNKAVPTIATTINPTATITIGSSVTDQATLTGGYPSTGVTGTVTYSLFSFAAPPSATAPCSGGTLAGSSQTVNVGTANSVPVSAAFGPPSPGFFGLSAVYNGNGNNTVATGNCEPLTVNKQTPTLTTTITPSSSVVAGMPVSDQATITGGYPSTGVGGTVTYRFFGLGNGVCSGTPAAIQTVNVGSGNAIPSSNSQTPSSPGQYSFNATYSGDPNNNQVTSSCELLTVNLISTTTGITCGSSVTVGVPTSCTVTVSDTAPGTITPTGVVNLSTNSTGTFAPPSPCSLNGSTSSSSCTFSYTPGALGAHNVTATYTGDNNHRSSSGSTLLSPGKHSTTISVSCTSPILTNQASTCTATVTDTSTVGATTPSGSVGFTETGITGSFNVTSCTLVGTGSTASCGVKFTPSAPGTANVVGSYGGDSTHNPSSNSASPTQITVNPSLIVGNPSATPANIDSGQSVALSASFSGGTPPYVCRWLQRAPGAITYTSLGSSSSCTSPVSTSSGILATVGSWSFELQVNESSSSPVSVTSGAVTVNVNAALSAPTISVSPSAVDLGQSATLTTVTSFSGGTAPFVCQWLAKAPGAASYTNLGNSFSCNAGDKPIAPTGVLSTAGSWSFELKVTDNGSPPELVASLAATATVNPALTAPVISASPTIINAGQTATLSTTTSFSAGTPTYVCQWLQRAPGASTYSNLGAPFACNAGDKPTVPTGALSTTGSWSFELQVSDSGSPSEVAPSNAVAVTVNGVLSAGAISPSAPTIDAGQTITLASNPSGGTTPYSYQWYSDGTCTTQIASAVAATFTASPGATSTYSVKVTDSASTSQCSPSDTVTVNLALVAGAIIPSAPTIDSGQSITLTASVSGGTAPYHYQWYSGTSASCSSDNTILGTTVTQLASPTASIYYCYAATDSANTPATQTSGTDLVTVVPSLVAGPITPASPNVDTGQSITLTANPSGGATPYAYQWYSAGGCPSTSLIAGATLSSLTASPSSTTTYSYRLTDSSQGSPAASTCAAGDVVTLNPTLVAGAITPANPIVDNGQSITLTSHATGGTPLLSYQWYSDGSCTTPISGATQPTYSTSQSSSATYSYKVTDSAYSPTSMCSGGDMVTVNPLLVAGAISPTAPTINGGQSITLTANPSGGTTPYGYQWYSDGTCTNLVSAAISQTFSTSPTVTTTYSYKVTDAASSPVSKCSPGDTVTVNSAISAGAITPANPTMDSGQSITLTSHVSGGTPPFSYQWYSDGTCGTSIAGATSSTFTASPSATISYSYKVTDSSQSPASGCSPAETVTVNPALVAGSVTPSTPTIDAGQSVTLSSHVSGGTPPISYRWYSDGTCNLPISGATSSTYLTMPSVTTTYAYLVTDSAFQPVSQCSPADTVTVNSALVTGSITPSSPTIDAGQSITLNASPSGGTTPYAYQWYSAASCPSGSLITGATLSTYAAMPTATTTYSYKVTDSSQGAPGNSQCSSGDLVTVNPALAAGAITPASPTIDAGQTIILASQASGGTPPLSYQWYSDGSCTTTIPGATSSTYSTSPTSSSTYSYKVTDAASSPKSLCSTGDTVTVNSALVAGAITPASPSINTGQSVTLIANTSGGTTPYSYQWYSDGACSSPISLATSSTYSASPSITTTYSYKVIDAAFSAASRCSAGDTITVNSAIVAGAITPANPTIDSGQSITLTSHESGGTPPFSYQWYSDGTCGAAIAGANSSTFTGSPIKNSTYSYKVTDSAQSPASACSSPETVTVNPALSAGPVTPSAPTIDAGQSITLTSHASGGTQSISYRWFSDGTCSLAISGVTSSTYVAAPSVTTTFAYSVTDSAYSPVSQCSAANLVTVNSALVAGAITPSAPAIDTGQSITLNANPTGGSTPYAYQWYSAASCPSGSLISGATSSTYSASPTSTTTYSYKATDSAQGSPVASPCSPGDKVTVNGFLSAGAISPNAPTIDAGQSIALNANPSGGSAPYSYQWYSDGTCTTAIPSATSSSYNPSPIANATYSYKVTDFSSASQCSPGDTVAVNPAIVAGAITPTSPTIDNGQSISLSAAASAGTAPYSYQWFTSAGCASGTQVPGATSPTLTASPSSTTTYSYKVTDSSIGNPAASACSAGDPVTVSPVLAAGPITPSGPTIDNGQSIQLTSAASGGTTTYSYQWFTGGTCTTAIPSATSSTYNASPTSSTTYSYKVTDSAFSPVSRCSSGNTVTVNSALVAGAITPASPKITSGQSLTLIANPSGGTAPYAFQWYSGVNTSCSSDTTLLGTAATQVVSPTSNTYYCYSVTDSAFTLASQSSNTNLVTINPPLTAGPITPSSPAIDIGQSITLAANPSGGTTPYSYQWYSGTSAVCSSDTAPLGTSSTQVVSSTSSAYYCYRVADSSAGNPAASATSSTNLATVNPPLAILSFTTTSPINSGQSTTITVSWSGGTSPYTLTLYTSTSSSSCTGLIQVVQNTGQTGATTSFTQSPTTTTSYCASVTDSAFSPVTIQTGSSSTVVVNPALIVNTPTSTSSAIDSGQQSTLAGTFTGGTSPYSCQWLQKPPGANAYGNLGNPSACSSPTPSTTGVLSTVGSWSFELQVTDSGSPSVIVTSNPVTITVNPVLTPPVISASPTTIGAGQHSTLSTTTSFIGGTPAYNCQWLKKGPLDGSFSIYGSSFSCVAGDKPTVSTGPLSTSGIWSFELQVSDRGSPSQVVISNAASVTVNGALSAGAVAPSSPAIDSGQSITLAANAFGGVQPYTYQWYSDSTCGTPISGAIQATYLTTPTATATYSYNVTDSTGAHQCSPGDTVTVNSVLVTGAITPSAPTIDNGQSITLSAKPSGGTAPYSYQWYSDGGCASVITGATGLTLQVTPGVTTAYAYKLGDASQGTPATSQCSAGDTVTVNPSLIVSAITPSSPTIDSGQSIALTSHATAGTPVISYQWYSDGTCGASINGAILPTYTATPTSTTTYSYKATDSAFSPESQCSAGDTVTVFPALVAGSATPATPFIDNGQSITLTAHPSGGVTPYTYQWHSGTSATCASDATSLGTAATQTVSPTTNTYYCYTVTDQSSSTQSSQTDFVTVSPALVAGAVTPPSPSIDNGQTITLTANPSGGTAPYHYQWYSSTNTVCPSGSPLGSATTLSGSPTVSTYYCYTVTDSSNGNTAVSVTSAAFLVSVSPTLTAGAIMPSSPNIDSGQSVILTANPSGGTTPYQYQWYSGPSPTCSSDNTQLGTASAQSVSPTSLTYYCYRVSDSSIGSPTVSSTSVTDLVTVSPPLVAGAMTPSSPAIDNGQSIMLAAKPSGGIGPYSYQWYSDGTCTASIPTATFPAYTASPSSTTIYTYKVTDSAYASASVCSPSNPVTVNPTLTAGQISPSNPTLDSGQSITLTSHASGGTTALSYQWYSDGTCGTPIPGAILSTYTALPTVTGIYSYKVVDSAFSPASQCSVGDTVIVVTGLSAGAITPASPKIDNGQSITLTANPSGGAGPYSYQWYSDGTCNTAIPSAISSTYDAPPTTTTTYSYKVTDSASSPATQCSTGNTVTVSPILVGGAPSPSSPTIDAGQSIVLTSHASGGTSPLSYQWYSDTSCTTLIPGATSSSYTATPGSTTYSYKVTDSAYAPFSSCSLSDSVTVNSALVAGAITPSSPAIDSGQSITLTSHGTGGTSPLSYQWYSDSICSAAIPGANSSTYSVSLPSTTILSYRVTDSAFSPVSQCSSGDTVTVSLALAAGQITPSGLTINNGQSITLTSAATGGTTPYSYQWYSAASCPSGSPISGAISSTLAASPAATTTYSYKVTDSAFAPVSQCSSGDTVTVNPTLAARSIKPSNPIIDMGQFILLTSQASGGTPQLSYQWYSDANCITAIAGPGAIQQTYLASPTVTSSYSYKVTDSANPPVSECSPADTVTVNAALTAAPAAPNFPTIDYGQSITLTVNPSGGTTPYHYQWYSGVSASCSSDTNLLGIAATQVVSPTTNTYYCYSVTDSSVGTPASTSTAISVSDLVSVSPPLSVTTPTSAPPAVDSGQSSTLSATFSGGVAPYTCQWLQKAPGASSYSNLGSSSGCTSSVSTSTGALTTVGTWSFELQVTDSPSSPIPVASSAVTVTVNAALSTTMISVNPTTLDLGQSTSLATTASFSGGTSPYVCQWLAKAPAAASYSTLGSSFSCNAGDKPTASTGVLSAAGAWSFELKVTDSGSPPQIVASNVSLTVKKASPSIATTLSSASITTGGSVTAAAAMTGGYQAGGSVAYEFYSGPTCTGTPVTVGSSVSVTNGSVPNSASQKFSTAGTYGWAAAYGGDSNNNPTVSNCQTLTVFAPPTLTVPGPQSARAGSTIRFAVNATGAGGCNGVTLSPSGLPPGATFVSTQCFAGSASSVFSWTPTESQAPGDYKVTFTATDAHGVVSTSQVTIHVNPVSKAAPLPILSYSVFGIVGFLAVVLVALVLKRVQTPRRKP